MDRANPERKKGWLARLPSPLSKAGYRYGCAVGISLAAAAVRLAFLQSLGSRATFLTFYPAVILAALYGGFGPGILAAVVSALVADYFWIEPVGRFSIHDPADWLSLAVFLLSCVMISAIAEAMQRAEARARRAEARARAGENAELADLSLRMAEERLAADKFRALFPYKTVFAIAMAALIAVGWFAVRNTAAMMEADRWEAHTRVVILEVNQFLSALKDAETGERGFLITGDERYLEPYQTALLQIGDKLESLKRLTQDNPGQQALLTEIEPLADKKLAELKQTIEARQTKGFDAAAQLVTTNSGKATMDEIRKRVADVQREEEGLLEKRSAAKAADTRSMFQTGLIGGLLAVGLLALVFVLLGREVAQRARAEKGLVRYRDKLEDLVAGRTAQMEKEVAERKRAEEALQKANEELEKRVSDRTAELRAASRYARGLLEASLDPLVTISSEGRVTDVNQATELAAGVPRERLIGSNFSDYFTDPEKARAGYQQVFREGFVRDYPLELRHRDGRVTSVHYNASVYRDESGEVIGVFAAARDITERNRAEEALRRANAYNRSLLEASLDPLVAIGPDGKITDVNGATETATGFGRAALIGTDYSDYFTEPEKARAGYQEVFRKGFVRDYPLELRHRDGRVTSVHYNASVYRDESGEVIGVFAAARDITERKRAEGALRQANAYNRSLLEASLDPLVAIGPDGKITDVNGATEAATGFARAALIGTDFSDYFTEPEKARAGYQKVFREGFVRDYPLELRNRDGRVTSVHYNASVYRDEGGQAIGIFAAARDVTERKRAEEKIQRYTEDLRRSNQELEHFAYVASHDLQEPLRSVSSFSQLLARRYQDKLDADAHEFIGFIVEGAMRMQTLINDLLSYSRVGTRGIPFTPVDCEEIVRTAKENLDATIAESGALFTHDPLPTVSGDPTQLTQIFQNLFSNAIKFRRPEEAPRIHVSAARQDSAWRFSVRDNGIGIEPRYFDRIFIIFQRLHGREDYPGTGIGLAVCKKIVERHGGRIWVDSEPGKGTTFHFTIPDEGRNRGELGTTRPSD